MRSGHWLAQCSGRPHRRDCGRVISGLSAVAFSYSAGAEYRQRVKSMPWWRMPEKVVITLLGLALVNSQSDGGLRPIMVKGSIENEGKLGVYEKWNTYSRVRAYPPQMQVPHLWGPSPKLPTDKLVPVAAMDIDGAAGTAMFHYDGTLNSIDFLQYDLVNLAYRLPGIHKSAVIGIGGGATFCRLICSSYGYNRRGTESNLHRSPHARSFYKSYSNLTALPI